MGVKSYCGDYIDISGVEWRLNGFYAVAFGNICGSYAELMPELVLDGVTNALKAYLRIMVGRCQAKSVYMAHHIITKLLRSDLVLRSFRESATKLMDACYAALRQREVGTSTIRQHVSTFRKFYVWAALRAEDQRWDGFSLQTAMQLKLVTIPSTTPGLTVRRMDPDEGPLTHTEYLDVADALRSAAADPRVNLGETAAMTLMLVLGVNPESLHDLQEEDLIPPGIDDTLYILRVPRIKKRKQRQRRDAFVERHLIREVGDLLIRLIENNRKGRLIDKTDNNGQPRFLFIRVEKSKKLVARGFDEVADQVHNNWFRQAARNLVSRYELTNDIGDELRLTPRRLRYTFMAREVAQGTPLHVLVAMMDHSDQRTLLVYLAARLDLVESLDTALGKSLEPLARLLLGEDRTEDCDSLPGVVDNWREELDLGVAPFACLSCRLFRPSSAPRLREMAGALSREARSVEAVPHSEERLVVLRDLAMKARTAAESCVSDEV